MNKWLVAAGVLAVLLIVAVAFAHGRGVAAGGAQRDEKTSVERQVRKAPTAGGGGRIMLTSR